MAGSAAVNGGADVVAQNADLDAGVLDRFSPTQTAASAAIGAGLSGAPPLAGLGWRTATDSGSSGFGDLTNREARLIQEVVREVWRPLDVVGSAASGERRGLGTRLPVGKGPGTRSDIDYSASATSGHEYEKFKHRLPSIDPSHGIIPGGGDTRYGPVLRFRPYGRPERVKPPR
jgi:hypothetical protein